MKRLALALMLLAIGIGGAYFAQGSAPFGRLLLAVGMPSAALHFLDGAEWRGVALYRAGRFEEAATAFSAAGRGYAFNRGNALARAGKYRDALTAYDVALGANPADEAAAANRALIAALLDHPEPLTGGASTEGGAAKSEKDLRSEDREGDTETGKSKRDGMAGAREAGLQSDAPGGSKVARKGATEQKAQSAGEGKANGSATDAEGAGKASITDAIIAKQFELVRKRELGKSYDAQAASANRQWLATLPDDPGRYLKLRLRAEHARRIELGTAMPDGEEP